VGHGSAPAAPDTEIVALRLGGGLGLTTEDHTRSERPIGLEKKNPRSAAYFNGMNAPGNVAVQMPSGRVARGAG
jgi:hypothetical protein